MQTSIEWLEEKLDSILPLDFEWYKIEKAFEKAKEMHKEEIIDAFYFYDDYRDCETGEKWVSNGEQYYQDKFKKD